MSDIYGCFYFWRSQTLDKAMSPRMVNWHLPATGPHTEKPRTRYVLLVNEKIKGKSERYSQLFGNNTKCSCFRDVCLLESQIKAGTNSKCPFYRGVRCTRSKRYPCVDCTRKRYPYGHHKMQYQAHGARNWQFPVALMFGWSVWFANNVFIIFFQLNGDQTRFLKWLFGKIFLSK